MNHPRNNRRYGSRNIEREREREREINRRRDIVPIDRGEELDREFKKNSGKIREYFIDCIKRGVVEIDYAESNVATTGKVTLKIQDPRLAGAEMDFDLYKRLRQIAKGDIIDRDWTGYHKSKSGGYWKEEDR